MTMAANPAGAAATTTPEVRVWAVRARISSLRAWRWRSDAAARSRLVAMAAPEVCPSTSSAAAVWRSGASATQPSRASARLTPERTRLTTVRRPVSGSSAATPSRAVSTEAPDRNARAVSSSACGMASACSDRLLHRRAATRRRDGPTGRVQTRSDWRPRGRPAGKSGASATNKNNAASTEVTAQPPSEQPAPHTRHPPSKQPAPHRRLLPDEQPAPHTRHPPSKQPAPHGRLLPGEQPGRWVS